jgi:hypothetical protein
MPHIVAFVGLIGAGKDTAADALPGAVRLAFADPIKDAVAAMFEWDRALLDGKTPESRAWREAPIVDLAAGLQRTDFTPRRALQLFGTEVGRAISPAIWTCLLARRLPTGDGVVFITDARFSDEIAVIREMGGTIIHIQRDPERETQIRDLVATGRLDGLHRSEYDWMAVPPDHTIRNEGTRAQLHAAVLEVVASRNRAGTHRS